MTRDKIPDARKYRSNRRAALCGEFIVPIVIISWKRRLICLFADADEIDFHGRSSFQKFTIREQLTGGVNPGRGPGVNFLGGRLYRSPVASNDHPLVPSSSFYADDKPSGVFAVLSFLPSAPLESTTGISLSILSAAVSLSLYSSAA